MTVKKISLNEEVILGDIRLIIKEITFETAQRKTVDFKRLGRFQDIIMKMPRFLQQPFITACYFYSRPYEVTPGQGLLKISGMGITSRPLNDEHFLAFEGISFQINGIDSFNGRGYEKNSYSNIVFFDVRDKRYNFDYKKQPFILTVTDDNSGAAYNIEVVPEWETNTYGFFNRKPSRNQFDPRHTVQIFRSDLFKGEKNDSMNYILADVRDKFPWSNMENEYIDHPYSCFSKYIGDYSGFHNVYAVHLDFKEIINSESHDVAEQTYYLVEDSSSWQIIDVTPATKSKFIK